MATLEPPTTARVTIETTKGSIEVEIWAKEVPVATKSFLQNCLDGKYTGQTFPTIQSNLIQLDPIDEASYHLKDEFHTRIRFNKKGLLGFLRENDDYKNNHSTGSFFITLTDIPQYNNRYIVFGKVVGDSFYNVLKIKDSELKDGIPIYPTRITGIEVNTRYFEDLTDPQVEEVAEPLLKKAKKAKTRVKLSYDDGEDEPDNFVMKSAHELLNDRKLVNKKQIVEKDTTDTSKVEVTEARPITDATSETTSTDANFTGSTSTDVTSETTSETTSATTSTTTSTTTSLPKIPVVRDPSIDSDYDPNLDLADEEFDPTILHTHKFIAS